MQTIELYTLYIKFYSLHSNRTCERFHQAALGIITFVEVQYMISLVIPLFSNFFFFMIKVYDKEGSLPGRFPMTN